MRARPHLRIVMLLENYAYPQDGRVRHEAASLTRAGYQVSVICPRSPGQPWSDTIDGVRVYRYPAPPEAGGLAGYLLEYGYSTAAMLCISLWAFLQHGFDVVHAHNPPETLCLVAALYKPFGVRFVFDQHDLSPEMYDARFGGRGSRIVRGALLLLERLSFRLADRVIATNESYRAIALGRGGVAAERVAVVRNGPELSRLRPVAPDPGLRAGAGATIAYVGVMGPQDGVDYLLRALGRLVHDMGRRDCRCVLIGAGDALDSLRALAAELGLDEHVRFTGWLAPDELLPVLAAADICVDPDPSNPYNDRSTMIKMMEYMALAKPIVAFDLPEHRFSARDAALYARPNDELDFARQIAALIDDPERRARMGGRGRERVAAALAWEHQEPRLLEVYAALDVCKLRLQHSAGEDVVISGRVKPSLALPPGEE